MPPSTHYLSLLNLNQAEEPLQHEEYSAEDISKQLELFTNSNFLDTEPFFAQPFDHSAFDGRLHNQQVVPLGPQLQRQRSISSSYPRNQRLQYQQQPAVQQQTQQQQQQQQPQLSEHDLTNVDYLQQLNSADFNSPLDSKRSAEEAELSYHATPASSEAGDDRKQGRSLDDEDKRRRNTAASARFRIKKKQREQALQESAKAMTDKNNALEARVKELELENRWLRSLLKPVNAEQSNNVLASL